AVLRYPEELALAAARDLLPDLARVGGVAALDGVDGHPGLDGPRGGGERVRLVRVVVVRRGVADEEEYLRGVGRGLRPAGLVDAVGEGLAHVFGRVAAARRGRGRPPGGGRPHERHHGADAEDEG